MKAVGLRFPSAAMLGLRASSRAHIKGSSGSPDGLRSVTSAEGGTCACKQAVTPVTLEMVPDCHYPQARLEGHSRFLAKDVGEFCCRPQVRGFAQITRKWKQNPESRSPLKLTEPLCNHCQKPPDHY